MNPCAREIQRLSGGRLSRSLASGLWGRQIAVVAVLVYQVSVFEHDRIGRKARRACCGIDDAKPGEEIH